MKKLFITLTGCLITALLISGCAKDPLNDMTQEESRIYITQKDSTAQFGSYHTFDIVDSVAVVNNEGESKELTAGDAKLLQLVAAQLEARGYVQVQAGDDPDLGINVTRISHTYLNVVPYPYDYWGYPGYWNPGFWGYPGYDYYFPPSFGYYPPMFRYYNTRSDVMVIDMIDLKNADKDQKLEGIWNASLKGEGVLSPGNYDSQIRAVFDQSPYLQTH